MKYMSVVLMMLCPLFMGFKLFKETVYVERDVNKWMTATTRVDGVTLVYKMPPTRFFMTMPKLVLRFIPRGIIDNEPPQEERVYTAMYNFYKPHSASRSDFSPKLTVHKVPASLDGYQDMDNNIFYKYIATKMEPKEADKYTLPDGTKGVLRHPTVKYAIGGREYVHAFNEQVGQKMELLLNNGYTLYQRRLRRYYTPINEKYYLCYEFVYDFYNTKEMNEELDKVVENMLIHLEIRHE